jgi:prephenate dehydrogenase
VRTITTRLAVTSHLPHLIAYTIVGTATGELTADESDFRRGCFSRRGTIC